MTSPAAGKALLYATALFIAGAICGAAVMHRQARPRAAQPLKLGRTGEIAAQLRTKLDSRLQLTPEQQQKFEPFFLITSTNLEAIHKDCLDQISAALDWLHAQMRPDLTPDQQQLLIALETERRELMLQNYNYCAAKTNSPAH